MTLLLKFLNSPHFAGFAALIAAIVSVAIDRSSDLASQFATWAFFGILAGNIVEAINKLGDKK
jgi:hypothetical protein